MAVLGVYYYLRKEAPIPSLVWMPLVCMMAFIIFFMVGFGAVAWTVTAELLPASARGKIYPFIVAFSWGCNFGFGYSFTHIQAGIYILNLEKIKEDRKKSGQLFPNFYLIR